MKFKKKKELMLSLLLIKYALGKRYIRKLLEN